MKRFLWLNKFPCVHANPQEWRVKQWGFGSIRRICYQKKTIILLEVLIAMTLASVCIIPLLVNPIKVYRSELEKLWEIESERIADVSFSELREQIYRNRSSWERLPKWQKSVVWELPSIKLSLAQGAQKQVTRLFTIKCTRENTTDDKIIRQCQALFLSSLSSEKKSYTLVVEKPL